MEDIDERILRERKEKLVCFQARVLAYETELESMKAENRQRMIEDKSPAYTEDQFYDLLKRYGFDKLYETALCDFFHNMD
jgi:hypothetical protein